MIQYAVPDEFLQQMNPQNKPALFVRFIQSGADDEKIDDFADLKASLSGNMLTATLPAWVFTDEYPETGGGFRSTIVLGSVPKGNEETPTASQSFFLSSSSSCSGSNIGNPLERDLEIASQFGLRMHPVSGKEKMHYGTDFKADSGDNVVAVADGIIDTISFGYDIETKTGYGRYVVLLHLDGSETLYAHLEGESTANLHVGEQVKRGDVIGKADTTGGVTVPHLHVSHSGSIFKPFTFSIL